MHTMPHTQLQWEKERHPSGVGFVYRAGSYKVAHDYTTRKCYLWIGDNRSEVASASAGRDAAQHDFVGRDGDMPRGSADVPDAQLRAFIASEFERMESLTRRVAYGVLPALIVSGPGGLGKTYPIEKILQEAEADGVHVERLSGSISAVQLYKRLYRVRDGGVFLLDDADVFSSTEALDILKAVLDSSPVRTVSWAKESRALSSEDIPQSYEFRGSVIFITNICFDKEIKRQNKRTEHVQALMSRVLYLPLPIRTQRERITRIRMMLENESFLRAHGLTEKAHRDAVASFIFEHAHKFRVISLREVVKTAQLFRAYGGDTGDTSWRETALATLADPRKR